MTGPGEPVLAVLPPADLAGSAAQDVLARGLVEDVAGELARFSALQLVACMSAFAVAGLPDREAGARLGATHLLRLGLMRASGRLRIRASLVETARGRQLWSDHVDAPEGELFALQDDIVGRIAATLVARLEDSALKAARRRPADSLAAYELTLRGMAALRAGTIEADLEARSMFERALVLDPHYARARAGISLSYFNEWSCRFWNRFAENGRLAYEHAFRALEHDDRDPLIHIVIGRVQLYRRHFEQAAWYLDRAHALCPSDPECLIQQAVCQAQLGRSEIGKALAAKAMRLHPFHPNWYFALAALPHLLMGELAHALELGLKVGEDPPFVDLPAYLAIAHAHLGERDRAGHQFALFLEAFRARVAPDREPAPGEAVAWFLEINPLRRREDVEFLLDGLRLVDPAMVEAYARTASDGASQPVAPRMGEAAGRFHRDGDAWVMVFAGRGAVLPDMKGLHDLATLLAAPGTEIHALDLAGRDTPAESGQAVLDARARHEIQDHLRDLQTELASAEDMNDLGRCELLRTEMDRLLEVLAGALGLGGRSRRLGDQGERARMAVTWRIRHAIRKIAAVHPELGHHLGHSVRTGTFCAYRPERAPLWRFVPTAVPSALANKAANGESRGVGHRHERR